ncbi:CvpA family protein [Leadbettera azotonutricia]|uniref:CvpA family protein n=1 Tax=Leadbettera azotonutricia (strain ATCC BAA-888 / DSM 13862 / ZAS-9) TaxID=545695 RepID=F5YFI7_LEAAZ|nr:CvpA family protein [Leadbettera azotonutricia]AEF81446.1 CvpA family protein [Leadbettera azotonutricia ZAS-9]
MGNVAFIDLVFLLLLVLLLIRGHIKGFIAELFSWASLVLGILASVYLYKNGAELIRTKILHNVKYLPEIMAFLAIFIVVSLVFKVIEKGIKEIIMGVKLGGVDKLLGAIFGFVEGIALISLLLFIISIQPLFDSSKLLQGSVFADLLLPLIIKPVGPVTVFVFDSLKSWMG